MAIGLRSTVKSQSAAPKTILPQAKANPAAAPYKSLDPIANIPSGLQRLLGNNLNSQPMATSTLAKAKVTRANPLVALRQLVSPTAPAVPSVNAASLQLATAQAYTANVPKFSIPGETMLTARQFQPMKNLVAAKKQLKSKTPHIIWQFIVFNHNEHQLEDIKTLSETYQVDELAIKTAQIYDYETGNELIPENESMVRTNLDKMTQKGYQSQYHTHTYTNKKGDVYHFCFEYGYLKLEGNGVLIVKRE